MFITVMALDLFFNSFEYSKLDSTKSKNEKIHIISKKFSFLSRYIQGKHYIYRIKFSKKSYNFLFNYSKSLSTWIEQIIF